MNLDENSTYKLTKIGIKDFEQQRMVNAGATITGYATTRLVPAEDKFQLTVTRNFDFIRTSPVVKVTDQKNGNFLIETENSFYSLEKVDNNVEETN